MTGAANTAVPAKTEIGLVLQGGGALGAYEWGAITALFDVIDEAIGNGQDITLRVVTGVSIGAINAACVVGATDRADARNRLGAMWGDFMIDLPYLPPSANRDLALYKVPHFYTYRSDPSRTFGALNVIAPSLLGAQLSEPAAGLHYHGNRHANLCAST